jgi:hypothetical protein
VTSNCSAIDYIGINSVQISEGLPAVLIEFGHDLFQYIKKNHSEIHF